MLLVVMQIVIVVLVWPVVALLISVVAEVSGSFVIVRAVKKSVGLLQHMLRAR